MKVTWVLNLSFGLKGIIFGSFGWNQVDFRNLGSMEEMALVHSSSFLSE